MTTGALAFLFSSALRLKFSCRNYMHSALYFSICLSFSLFSYINTAFFFFNTSIKLSASCNDISLLRILFEMPRYFDPLRYNLLSSLGSYLESYSKRPLLLFRAYRSIAWLLKGTCSFLFDLIA